MRRRVPGLLLPLVLLVWSSGCVMVRPWQRERLATPAMEIATGEAPMAAEYRAKLVEAKTGGGEPGDAPGGGCGCTQ